MNERTLNLFSWFYAYWVGTIAFLIFGALICLGYPKFWIIFIAMVMIGILNFVALITTYNLINKYNKGD